jgi:thiol:disulfide interchange protein DsbD
METIKRFFGVLLLAVAIYLVSPLFPVVAQMLAWATLLIITAIYLHALDPLPPGVHGFRRFSKAAGVIALVAGVVFMIGALSGGRDILRPLSGLRVGEAAPESAPVAFQRVNNLDELEGAIRAAAGRPIMLDFYADWCVSCKEMERYTFSDVQVRARLERMAKLQADVTANTAEQAALLKRFNLFGPPGIIFFDRGGREIQGLRVIGFQPADKFSAVLDQALAFQ